jgi:PST family polysaccharide transporter
VRSPAARAAAQNLGWLVAEKMARLVFSVLIGFVVARYLGPAQFGLFNYAFALVTLAGALAEVGLEAVVKRELIRAPAQAGAVLAAAWRLRLIAGAACYAVVLGWAWWGEADAVVRVLLAIMGLLLFQPALAVADLWLQANLQARRATLAQVLALSVGAGARLALVVGRAPLWTFGAVLTGEAFLAAGALRVLARRAGMPSAGGEVKSWVPRLAAEAWPLLLSSVAVMIYMRIDVVMLRRLAGADAAGVYAAAVRISELWYFLPVALGSSLLPALLRSREAGAEIYARRLQGYFDANAALAYGLSVPIALAAPWLVQVAYGARFAGAGPVLALHIWAAPFVFIGVARGQFLVNEKLTRFGLVATLLGALANVALNYALIPRAGPMGAAWATVASYALAAWGSSFLHPAVRAVARMQTRALLLPLTGWRYLRRA